MEGLISYGYAEYIIHCNCCRVSHNSRISIYDTRRRHVDGLQDVSGAEVETMCIVRENAFNKGIHTRNTSNDGFMYIHNAMAVYVLDSCLLVSEM